VTKLKTTDLTRRFMGLVAVNKVSFSMDEGEILGIIGPNGAGKTTFINLVSGIVMPSEGKIEYKGRDITYAPAHERARMGIARTYQLIHPLENLTLIENVMVGSIFARGRNLKEARIGAEALCAELASRQRSWTRPSERLETVSGKRSSDVRSSRMVSQGSG